MGLVLLGTVAGFLPETARHVVGNGSHEVTRWWERRWAIPLMDGVTKLRQKSKMSAIEKGHNSRTDGTAVVAKKKPRILNPLQCVRILFLKDAAPIALVHGFNYMIDYSVQTSIPPAFKDIYGFNELGIGLSYLPRGIGIIIGGYTNGRLMDLEL